MMLKFNSVFRLDNITPDSVNSTIKNFILRDEKIIAAYKTIRDQVVFTTKRVIFTDITGLISPNQAVITMPYSKVLYYAVYSDTNIFSLLESSHLYLLFANNIDMDFMFKGSDKIYEIAEVIDKMILDPNYKEEQATFEIPQFVKKQKYYLKSNMEDSLRPISLELQNDDDGFLYQIEFDRFPERLKGVKFDLTITNIFNDSETIKDIYVCTFEKNMDKSIKTKKQPMSWSNINSVEIKSVSIVVTKYIDNNNVVQVDDHTLIETVSVDNIKEKIYSIIEICEGLGNAADVFKFITSEDTIDLFSPDIVKSIEDVLPMEKIYGNQKKDAIKKLSAYADTFY